MTIAPGVNVTHPCKAATGIRERRARASYLSTATTSLHPARTSQQTPLGVTPSSTASDNPAGDGKKSTYESGALRGSR